MKSQTYEKNGGIVHYNQGFYGALGKIETAKADYDSFIAGQAYFRNYEAQQLHFAQAVEFYKSASPERIRDLLAIRRCELAPFNKPAPPDFAALKKIRGLP
jgi:hypothetical protein